MGETISYALPTYIQYLSIQWWHFWCHFF